jgi:hypothetical protein
MTGDCHVRFCERMRGVIPLVLLGEISVDLSVIICYTKVHRGNTENHRVVGNDLITPDECCGNSSDA